MESVARLFSQTVAWLWGPYLIGFFFVTAVFYTFRLHCLQFLRIPDILRGCFKKDTGEEDGEITSFEAAMTTLAGMVGAGNLAGVAGAVVIGGPGVIFWMVLAAFFAMALKFAEIALAMKYRYVRPNGRVAGGASFYLFRGLRRFRMQWLAYVYSFSVMCFAITGMGGSANAIAEVMCKWQGVSVTWTAGAVTFAAALVLMGGIKRIGKVCSLMAPVMGFVYFAAGIVTVFANWEAFPTVAAAIWQGAFCPEAAAGGAAGSLLVTLRAGVSRGILSNEAGIATSTMVASAARVEDPVEQALWGPLEVFIDVVLCVMTGYVIVLSGLWQGGEYSGAVLTREAFARFLPGGWGGTIVLVTVLLFCFSTTLALFRYWQMGCLMFIENENHWFLKAFYCASIFFMSITSFDVVWAMQDISVAMMAVPNLIGVLLLSGEVVAMKDAYFSRQG